ncbi:MAG: type III-A CRISPR-associated RAMP protein Csm4 [Anaerolineae bacterium]|nr:type III-A CRISPR-associated RAMP protein Csm4 [Anaerolineae bacterium]
MAELTVYRLTFRSGFHVGARGVGLEESAEHIPSDTLFSALMDAVLRTGARAEDFARPFQNGAPPFLLTSAFPFAGSVRFFPMPVPLDRWFSPETLRERSKDLKKIKFLSDDLFRRMLEGEPMDNWLFPEKEHVEPTRGVALQGGIFWLTTEEVKGLPEQMRVDPETRKPIPLRALRRHRVFASEQVPRVTLDRITSASNIFHAGRVSFSPGCGLWFGVHWRRSDPALQDLVHQALTVLADDGLGGERTVGYGGFSWEKEKEPLALPGPTDGGLLWLLSRYHPREAELPGALTGSPGYALTAVAGWLRTWEGAAQRRQRLWLVVEGSIVRAVGPGPWGDLTDVRPRYRNPDGDLPHPVWRCGFALGAAVAPDSSGAAKEV